MPSPLSVSAELNELANNLEAWQLDPVAFVREAINAEPDTWQEDALWDLVDHGRVTISACHGPGKDALAAWAVLWCLICFEHPKIPCTAPTSPQLRDLLWAEIAKWRRGMIPYFADLLEVKNDRIEYREHAKTWFAVARTARKENPEALQGFHADTILVVVDEASGVPGIIFEVLAGAMTGPRAMMLLIGNPTQSSGYFFDSHNTDRERWRCFRVFAAAAHDGSALADRTYTSARVSPAYVADIKKKYGIDSNVYRVRVLGLFPKSESDQTIPYEWLELARSREAPANYTPKHFAIAGLDVARFGSDDSAWAVRQGPDTLELDDWHGHDEDYTAGRALAGCKRMLAKGVPLRYLVVDAAGVGAGVVKRLKRFDHRGRNWFVDHGIVVIGAMVGTTSPDIECALLRDALWWRARQVFDPKSFGDRTGGLPRFSPTIDQEKIARLTAELSGPKFGYAPGTVKIKIESKDDMKLRLICSPDMADAWNLTLYFEAGMPEPEAPKKSYEDEDGEGRFTR